MEIGQQILLWLFGFLTVVFLLVAIASLFMDGISNLGVSDRANKISHFYGLLAAFSTVAWFIAFIPEESKTFLFCMLPMFILIVGMSYTGNLLNRKFAKWFFNKLNNRYFKENK